MDKILLLHVYKHCFWSLMLLFNLWKTERIVFRFCKNIVSSFLHEAAIVYPLISWMHYYSSSNRVKGNKVFKYICCFNHSNTIKTSANLMLLLLFTVYGDWKHDRISAILRHHSMVSTNLLMYQYIWALFFHFQKDKKTSKC